MATAVPGRISNIRRGDRNRSSQRKPRKSSLSLYGRGPMWVLTQQRLKSLLHYDPVTGIWTWRVQRQQMAAGSVAGYVHKQSGRRLMSIDGKRYYAYRLAVLYMTGAWPANEVDHQNLNKADDAWSNIREATHSQNNANVKRRIDNSSGYKGVSWHKRTRTWRADICINGRQKSLGHFASAKDAHDAYKVAAALYFQAFARTS